MNAKTIMFLSIITTVYIVESFMPFLKEGGAPFSVFFSLIFYHFIGSIAIKYFYLLFTVNMIRGLPVMIEFARSMPAFFQTITTFAQNLAPTDPTQLDNLMLAFGNMPIWQTTLVLYGLAYSSTLIWFATAKFLLKKSGIIFRLLGIKN